jgi:glycolate oxidase FAD binding subunit
MCGAYGTLSVLTEMTFRVYPKPAQAAVLCLADVTPQEGFAALRRIAHSALEPAGLAYLPAGMMADVGQGAAVIKLEGARQPLEEKITLAHGILGKAVQRVEQDPFPAIGSGALFADLAGDVWRVMVAPSDAPELARQLNAAQWLGDWAGGMIWLAAAPTDAARIRKLAADAKGQALLLRASVESRALHGLYAPQPPALGALSRAVKAAFDPLSLFNPNRL